MLIRPFDGSRHDSEGLLAVERETFAESPYNADEETIIYRGIWMESVIAKGADREVQAALFSQTVERAERQRLDEVGCLVSVKDHSLRQALVSQGCRVVNEYYIFRRDL